MPIYEYQCDDCGHLFEKMKKRSDPEPDKCPECGAPNPRRAISTTAFQLKGGGWYVTDYGGKKSASTSSDGDSSGGDGADESSSSDSSSSDSDSSEPAPATNEVA